MILILSTLIGLAFGQDSGEAKFARGLLRRVNQTAEAPVVIFTAGDGHSCRRIIDHLGLWAARTQRVLPIEDAAARADFARNSARETTRFGAFAAQKGLVLVTKIEDARAEDLVARVIADRVLGGGDRDHWGFRATDHVAIAIAFEVRPTAPFFPNEIVRSLFPRADGTGAANGCRYRLFTRATLRAIAHDWCRAKLEPEGPSGWFKPTS